MYTYDQYGNPYVYSPYPVAFVPQPYNPYQRGYPPHPYYDYRQQPVQGQASWTEGGAVTKCDSPWSLNQYMTVAVSENSPYKCGQKLKVKNLSSNAQKEITVTVVDQVKDYPPNKINLHRKAFEAVGANLDAGVINVQITPMSNNDQSSEWGKYLMNVTQTAYPNYQISDYKSVSKSEVSANQTKEVYEYVLKSQQETLTVQASVTYNPNTGRVVSFDLKEV